eukprot:1140291-Pelagomonas_calceolata.AAC.1
MSTGRWHPGNSEVPFGLSSRTVAHPKHLLTDPVVGEEQNYRALLHAAIQHANYKLQDCGSLEALSSLL